MGEVVKPKSRNGSAVATRRSKRMRNASLRSQFSGAIKLFRLSIQTGKNASNEEHFKALTKSLDIISRKGIYHKNKTARLKRKLHSCWEMSRLEC